MCLQLDRRGVFKQNNVRVLGTPIQSVIWAEDRQAFSDKLVEINEKAPRRRNSARSAPVVALLLRLEYPVSTSRVALYALSIPSSPRSARGLQRRWCCMRAPGLRACVRACVHGCGCADRVFIHGRDGRRGGSCSR